MILITYPDRICYCPGCDDRECRVLILEGVRIGERADIPLGCLTSGNLLRRHSTRMSYIRKSTPPTFHPDVLHPEICSADIPPGCLTSGNLLCRHSTRMSHIRNSSPPPFHPDISHPALEVRWERRAFQLLRSDISGSSDSAYPESFEAILHSAVVFS